MKRFILTLTIIIMSLSLVVPAFAYEDLDVRSPGDVVDFDSSFFIGRDETIIDSRVPFTASYFRVAKKEFAKGASFVSSVKMNTRKECLQVIFKDTDFGFQRSSPNVILDRLELECIKSVKDSDGTYIIRSGDRFNLIEPLMFTAGTAVEEEYVFTDSVIDIYDGEERVIDFNVDQYADVEFYFGSIAIGRSRVYDGDKGFYSYSSEVPLAIERRNKDKYIDSIDLGTKAFAAPMDLYINGSPSSHLYYYDRGKLTEIKTARWDDFEYAWRLRLQNGRHILVCEEELVGITNSAGGGYTPEDEEYWIEKYNEPPVAANQNPNTGRYSTATSVSISAIAGIVAVAVVTVIFAFAKAPRDKEVYKIIPRRKR